MAKYTDSAFLFPDGLDQMMAACIAAGMTSLDPDMSDIALATGVDQMMTTYDAGVVMTEAAAAGDKIAQGNTRLDPDVGCFPFLNSHDFAWRWQDDPETMAPYGGGVAGYMRRLDGAEDMPKSLAAYLVPLPTGAGPPSDLVPDERWA